MSKTRTPRQEALLYYIHQYLIEHNGRPPTLNEMLAAKVGRETSVGVITSKSVLRYNLLQLEEQGAISLLKDGSSRNIVVPGIVAGIPVNVTDQVEDSGWYDYVLLDIDSWPDGNLPEDLVKTTLWDWTMDPNKVLLTVSNLYAHCYGWAMLELGPGGHRTAQRPYELLLEVGETGYFPDNTAVITDRHDLRLAAVGIGVAVFSHKEAHGFEPPKRP